MDEKPLKKIHNPVAITAGMRVCFKCLAGEWGIYGHNNPARVGFDGQLSRGFIIRSVPRRWMWHRRRCISGWCWTLNPVLRLIAICSAMIWNPAWWMSSARRRMAILLLGDGRFVAEVA